MPFNPFAISQDLPKYNNVWLIPNLGLYGGNPGPLGIGGCHGAFGRFSKPSTGPNGRTISVAVQLKAYIGCLRQSISAMLVLVVLASISSLIANPEPKTTSQTSPATTNLPPHVLTDSENRKSDIFLYQGFSQNTSIETPTSTKNAPTLAINTIQKRLKDSVELIDAKIILAVLVGLSAVLVGILFAIGESKKHKDRKKYPY
jgi:hypothetical protein